MKKCATITSMATKANTLRQTKFKRVRFSNNLYIYFLMGGKTHKKQKKPKEVILEKYKFRNTRNTYKNISLKHKIKTILWNKITPSANIYQNLKFYFAIKNGHCLINYLYDPFSPVNSRSIAIKSVMTKFYEIRDLDASLSNKNIQKNYLKI